MIEKFLYAFYNKCFSNFPLHEGGEYERRNNKRNRKRMGKSKVLQ